MYLGSSSFNVARVRLTPCLCCTTSICFKPRSFSHSTASLALASNIPPISLAQLTTWNDVTFPRLRTLLLALVALDDARCGLLPTSDVLRVTEQRLGAGWSLASGAPTLFVCIARWFSLH